MREMAHESGGSTDALGDGSVRNLNAAILVAYSICTKELSLGWLGDVGWTASGWTAGTWAISPVVEPPLHANDFVHNLHFALPATALSKYCQMPDSSAHYVWTDSACDRVTSAISAVYNTESIGLRTDPCGTPKYSGKERNSISIAPFIYYVYLKALRHGSQFYLQIHHACLHKRSPDGATPNWGRRHPAYYLSIDPKGIEGWVGLVGWLIVDGLPTQVVTHQLQVSCRTGKVRRPKTDVLLLCHATN